MMGQLSLSVLRALPVVVVASACTASGPRRTPASPGADEARAVVVKMHAPSTRESAFLSDLRQLTFGGENAEAYWAFDGRELSFQARGADQGCDRIYRMDPDEPFTSTRVTPVSSGAGATTCAHFFPGGGLLYASTHLAGAACPPRPDMSLGYVWALHPAYDIFSVDAPGAPLRRLTSTPGYDAEGTVCAKDGSIVFTSVRDGDLELYRMDRDGGHVRRLTSTPGYDGGAFFNADCTKIVWRASRPEGAALGEYKALLARGLVRPSKLELWIANADGTDARQLTYLDAASFAPSFHPTLPFIVFSTNYQDGDPDRVPVPPRDGLRSAKPSSVHAKGREFDLWAIGTDGAHLTRITDAPGFDGFPHFSPDGRWLAFSSNRATAPGAHDTNVFAARWTGAWPPPESARAEAPEPSRAADRIARDVAWLAAPEREGRGAGTAGLQASGEYLARELERAGVEPAGDAGYEQPFAMRVGLASGAGTKLVVDGRAVSSDDVRPAAFSASARATGPAVLAGYGLVDPALGVDDYAGKDVRGRIVVVRRFAPETPTVTDPAAKRRLGDLRRKAFVARERGARALVVVDWPAVSAGAPAPAEAAFPSLHPEGPNDAGLPVVLVRRAALAPVMDRLAAGKPVPMDVSVELTPTEARGFNVVGRIRATRPGASALGPVLIGAHYDHLGMGGRFSLAPERHEAHGGADDNASGTATVLEAARALAAHRDALERDVIVAFFAGEELGLLGSSHFVRARPELVKSLAAMINLDMVGRLRDDKVDVLGSETADEWPHLIAPACAAERVTCAASGDGYGPSDQASFYPAGVPVLHFFTGAHDDYHKPSDTADRVNAAGAAAISRILARLATSLGPDRRALSYRRVSSPAPVAGDARSFGASLGTIPDYAGPPAGTKGMLLAGVRPGGAADRAGLRRGDLLVRLGAHAIGGVEDLMYVLNEAHPGETVKAVVVRDGTPVELPVTFEESRRR